ncbi:MAG: hypothetical protein H0U95_17270 [Bacteroidetes bacterium]|nr:hypothetical protein [Bacteroidota bacterium]
MRFFLICLVFQASCFLAQKQYQFPEYFNPAFDMKPEEIHKSLMKQDLKGSKLDIERYITTVVYGEQFKLDNNTVYLNWNEVEKYINNIAIAILPPNAMNKNLNFFIGRSHYSDANVSRFGNLIFNVGKIYNEENETFLAYDLAIEASHYLFKHMLRDDAEAIRLQADSFAIAVLKGKKLIHDSVIKVVLKKGDPEPKGKKYGDVINKTIYIVNTKYFLDSITFKKLKKIAGEERKKLAFEDCDFDHCLKYAFVDYLTEPKNLKNLYYIIESIRRTMYSKVELRKTGFLTENSGGLDLYYYNKSILYEPEYIFSNEEDFIKAKEHNFFMNKNKPFNTYEEGFRFFIDQALKNNFNEANYSLALDFYALNKTDSTQKYLNKYLKNGIGLYSEMAQSMVDKGHPYIEKGKTFVLYNNVEHLSEDLFNYYLSRKRKLTNSDFKNEIGKDSNSITVLLVNELLGVNPKKLNQTQKLMNSIFSLYNDDDKEMCKKITRNSHYAGEDKVLPDKFKKNFLIYAPEWYSWYKENNCNKLFFIDVRYHYFEFINEIEYYNFYTVIF